MLRFSAAGIDCRLSLLFPALVVVMLTLDTTGVAVWCIGASMMHEMGHFAALLLFGKRPARICMGIFGVRIEQNPHTTLGYGGHLCVSLAGPAVNAAAFFILLATAGGGTAMAVHGTLALLNLLPVEPLDGGQALFFALARVTEERIASRIVLITSVCTLLPLAAAGFTILLRSGYNFTLLALCGYLCLLILCARLR